MPGQFESILDKLQRKLGKQTIRKASTIARPKPRPDVIQMQAINDFMRRNPRAGGGLLNGSSEEAAAAEARRQETRAIQARINRDPRGYDGSRGPSANPYGGGGGGLHSNYADGGRVYLYNRLK